jgi:hypothetical protein
VGTAIGHAPWYLPPPTSLEVSYCSSNRPDRSSTTHPCPASGPCDRRAKACASATSVAAIATDETFTLAEQTTHLNRSESFAVRALTPQSVFASANSEPPMSRESHAHHSGKRVSQGRSNSNAEVRVWKSTSHLASNQNGCKSQPSSAPRAHCHLFSQVPFGWYRVSLLRYACKKIHIIPFVCTSSSLS